MGRASPEKMGQRVSFPPPNPGTDGPQVARTTPGSEIYFMKHEGASLAPRHLAVVPVAASRPWGGPASCGLQGQPTETGSPPFPRFHKPFRRKKINSEAQSSHRVIFFHWWRMIKKNCHKGASQEAEAGEPLCQQHQEAVPPPSSDLPGASPPPPGSQASSQQPHN